MPSYHDFLTALAIQESSNQPWIENSGGYVGLYQMGESALQDAGYYYKTPASPHNSWTGVWTGNDGINSLNDFMTNPSAQTDALNAYFSKNIGSMRNWGLDDYIGDQITASNGVNVNVTESGMLAGAHLVGIGNLNRFLTSDGEYVPSDSNHIPITTYMNQFAGYDTPFDFNSTPNPVQYTNPFPTPDIYPNVKDIFSQNLMSDSWDHFLPF